jgi:hypothetical protein
MDQRLKLQALLESLCPNVYFQPPPNLQMVYPAIVYERDNAVSEFAGNKPYRHTKRYQVTVIDPDPDSEIHEKVAELPLTSFSRHFATAGLNHDVYNLYF